MTDRIGQWATTPRSTRWHLIESEVADDVITRCGRRLHPSEVKPIRTHDTPDLLCRYCNRP